MKRGGASAFKRLREFAANLQGGATTTFAIAAVPLFAAAALSVEFASASYAKQNVQNAVDAAALAAVPLAEPLRADVVEAQIRAHLAHKNIEFGTAQIVSDADNQTVTVTLAAVMPTSLGALFASSLDVSRTATAKIMVSRPNDTACVIALSPAGVGIGAHNSSVTANCAIYSNSTNTNAMEFRGPSRVKTTSDCAVGAYEADKTALMDPPPTTGCIPVADPLAAVQAPLSASEPCKFNNKRINGQEALTPGAYCGGLDIASGAKVTFAPGIYVIRDGQFKIGSGANVDGAGVLFYLVGANSTADWGSNANIQLRGLTSGAQAGMLFWSASANATPHKIGCGSSSYLEGAVYSPRTDVEIGSNAGVSAVASWTVWVVKSLQLGSSADLTIKADFSGALTPLPAALSGDALKLGGKASPYLVR